MEGTTATAAILQRELRTLRREVEAYPSEQAIWKLVPGIPNSAGTLVLHLAGNIQHYIGARLTGTAYVRDRPAEFSRRDVPRSELLTELAAAEAAIERLKSATLPKRFPERIGGFELDTEDFLVHLIAHLAYHLGQVDYHRRLVTGDPTGAGALRPGELSSARAVE
jgi:hypothetical protein